MLEIGKVRADELAKKFGTPLMAFDLTVMRSILRQYTDSFKSETLKTDIIYASKAFNCKAMISLIEEYGMCLDVVSAGELYTAQKAGYDCSKVYFHGNNKSIAEMKMALEGGVGTIVVDSLPEAELLTELASGLSAPIRTLLRVNPGIDAHTHKYIVTAHDDSKFGMLFSNEEEIVKTIRLLQKSPNIIFDGLDAHIGSQVFDKRAFIEEIRMMFEFAGLLKEKYEITSHSIDLGGGFATFYTDEDAPIPIDEVCQTIVRTCEEENEKIGGFVNHILIEPGRSIAAAGSYTLYTAGFTKKTLNKNYVFIDGGMSDNIRPALYQAKYRAFVAGKEAQTPIKKYTIAGKCCESGDILIEDLSLPQVDTGDILIIPATGAYCYSMASNYNKLLFPEVVFVEDGEARVVIRRQTLDDLISREV